MSEKTVSIIVPVYNAEAYLDAMASSIRNQTVPDWELILIDDGSTDGSGAICDRLAESDPRIVVRHIENEGVANARNVGLSVATGQYLAFCDSDDRCEPNFLQTLLELHQKTGAELCAASVFVDSESGSRVHPAPCVGSIASEDFAVILHGWFDIYWMGLWNKLFSAEIVRENGIRFQTGLSIGEDSLFILRYLAFCGSVACGDTPIYHYVQRNAESLTRRFHADHVRGYAQIIAALKERAAQFGCMDAQMETLCEQKYGEALGTYLYMAMADERVDEQTRRAAYRNLKNAPRERKLLASSGGVTNRLLGTCPYAVLKCYFKLLSLRKRK